MLDPLYRTKASPIERTGAQDVCNADMQTLVGRCTGMTQTDVRTFLLAWKLVSEWIVRSRDTGPLLLVPSDSLSMWTATPEPSKRDQLNPARIAGVTFRACEETRQKLHHA